MTMTPDRFHDLFDQAVATGPTHVDTSTPVTTGRRLLRRRRVLEATAAAAAVVAVAGTTFALASGDATRSDDGLQPVGSHDPVSAAVLEQCAGATPRRAADALFGPGDPTVTLASAADESTFMVLHSTDGRAWGTCHVVPGEPTDLSAFGSEPYVAPEETGNRGIVEMRWFSESRGIDCDGDMGPCDRFIAWSADRLPPAVSQVELETADGQVTRVLVEDGYYVFNHVGEMPGTDETEPVFEGVRRITYLDADGEPIAENLFAGRGPELSESGLPGLQEAYPSLASPLPR